MVLSLFKSVDFRVMMTKIQNNIQEGMKVVKVTGEKSEINDENLNIKFKVPSIQYENKEVEKSINSYVKRNIKEFIIQEYGKEYSNWGRSYSGKKAKQTQDAHEAIRPTSELRHPDKMKNYLKKDQYQLYKLIWNRVVGSQMSPAVYNTLSVNLLSN